MRYNSLKCIYSFKIINISAPSILQDPLMTLYLPTYDEVPAPLLFVLAPLDQLLGGEAVEVAGEAAQHDGDVAHHLLHHGLRDAVDAVAGPHRDLPLVGAAPLPRLRGVNILVGRPHGARHHTRPRHRHVRYPDTLAGNTNSLLT